MMRRSGRNPIGQSEACVFNRSGTVWDLVDGNMRCCNLRLNANRTQLSFITSPRPQSGLNWSMFTHIGRTVTTQGKSIISVTSTTGSLATSGFAFLSAVTIADKRHTFQFESQNPSSGGVNGNWTGLPEMVIARL